MTEQKLSRNNVSARGEPRSLPSHIHLLLYSMRCVHTTLHLYWIIGNTRTKRTKRTKKKKKRKNIVYFSTKVCALLAAGAFSQLRLLYDQFFRSIAVFSIDSIQKFKFEGFSAIHKLSIRFFAFAQISTHDLSVERSQSAPFVTPLPPLSLFPFGLNAIVRIGRRMEKREE